MSLDEKVVIMYVPCGTESEAARIAAILIEEHLIACANIYASRSIYKWEGELADETEYVMWAKTTSARSAAATRRSEELHSYNIPCILTLAPDSVNLAYESWVRATVSPASVIEPGVEAESV